MNGAKPLPNLTQVLYRAFLRPFFFSLDPETAHRIAVTGLKMMDFWPLASRLAEASLTVRDPALQVNLGPLRFFNPVGLAAGFDKNAELIRILARMGFGFLEIGTFTPKGQEGQPRPRLFRIKERNTLINRMGFNNPGIEAAMDHLQKVKPFIRHVPVGVNIGKGKETPLEKAVDDYTTAFERSYPLADYIVINVSSPNTPNLRDLQQVQALREIVVRLLEKEKSLNETNPEQRKLIFTKVSPDCHEEQVEEIGRLAVEFGLGLIATNTTIDRSLWPDGAGEAGGLSGRPLREKSNRVLSQLRRITKGKVPIIGVGGIFSAEDAYEKIRLGASLVQIYTGWIFNGPALVPDINKGLISLMKRDGFNSIREAVGTLA